MKIIGFLSLLITFLISILIFICFLGSQSKREFRISMGLQIGTSLIKESAFGALLGMILIVSIILSFALFSLVSEIRIANSVSSFLLMRKTTSTFLFALIEEFVFRSLILGGLYFLSNKKWMALFISSILFGFAHAANPDAGIISISSNFLGGLMYGIAFLGTGRIWLPTGLHFAWNYFQGPIFGFNVSGINSEGLYNLELQGNTILTGGRYGPEASIIAIGFRLICILILIAWFKKSLFKTDTLINIKKKIKGKILFWFAIIAISVYLIAYHEKLIAGFSDVLSKLF